MSSEPAESTEFWNGFMPTNPPITRLPSEWESWEVVLEAAMNEGLQLGSKVGITEEEKQSSEQWRLRVRELPVIAAPQVPKHIHRARLVLVWILHFYVHTLTPQSDSEPARISPSLSVPLLQISKATDQPPVLTYADEVILNSYFDASSNDPKCLFLFDKDLGSIYEQAFHLTSARFEWEGATSDACFTRYRYLFGGHANPRGPVQSPRHTHPHSAKRFFLSRKLAIRTSSTASFDLGRMVGLGYLKAKRRTRTRLWDQVQPKALSYKRSMRSLVFHPPRIEPPSRKTFLEACERTCLVHTESFWNICRMEDGAFQVGREAYEKAVDALKQSRDVYIMIATLLVLEPARRAEKAREGEMKGMAGVDFVFLKDVRNIRRSSRAGSCE
uniref:Uncharacterized protein n=1 Tax=Moniliophthora roreri TaxID=221103 RepID=A0A0W0GDG7_MONRR